ncbi:hypothetical protein [Cytobacillus horneckiae]|nr:hypothetical protein [Cytobacillus horneckiae]MEC1155652.1 hypothetical protein [Cytobacillus horneckiae]MED2936970.1 hypothetical protein [Cytobacillus horneckiae]
MYKIKTPSNLYNGITSGIQFKNGIGLTNEESVKNVLIHDFNYTLIEGEKETQDDDIQLSQDVDKYHKGSGYYEFPNGETIRGKEKAQEYLLALKDEEGGQQ